jgi:2-oxo-4-hydroxy-4-carboxy-5-ureidoimidazoline decarboxylase
MTLAEVNDLDRDGFANALGHVFEHSPWVAAEAWRYRPFDSAADLSRAMQAVLGEAGADAQLALIRAHPDLAGKAARAETLTRDSAREQAGADLDRLSAEEYEQFHRLNAAYQAKFTFPFIICVRQHDKHAILAAFERRLGRDAVAERRQALHEIGEIVRLRLSDLIQGS